MVNRNLIFSLEDDAIATEMGELFSTTAEEDLEELNLSELYYPCLLYTSDAADE